ncbi:MAG: hypothetical protein LC796_16195 [Acidobacteria bacterium]|nr:hypothetical protein [Acidobacteriota bacterium]
MSSPGRPVLCVSMLLLSLPLFAAEDVKVSAGAVEDQRSSDGRMSGLSIEIKLAGGALAEVKALRTRLKSAKDDVGTVLYKAAKSDKPRDFEEFSPDRRPGPRINLSSPSRDASTVEAAGEVELFIPSRDPNTKQRFEKFLGRLDKPISSSALKSAKVEITPLSAAAYKARQQQNKPTKEQITAEAKKQGATDAEIKQAIALVEAFTALGGEEPSETSVLIETKDPDGKIISIDLVGADGSELKAPSRGSSGGREDKLVKIDLSEKPPPDAALVVTLRTSRSVVSVPLNFKEVALP